MKIGSQLFFTTASNGVYQVGMFVLSVVLARYFSKDDYGTYLHVQLIINISTWAFVLGIPHSVYYFLPNTREKRKYILETYCVLLVIALLTAIGVYALRDELVNLLNNSRLLGLITIISGLLFFQIPLTIFQPIMISSSRVMSFVRVDFVFNFSFFFVVFIPVMMGKDVLFILNTLLVYYIIQFVTITFVLLKLALQNHNSKNPEDGKTYTLKEQFKYSLPIGASQGLFEVAGYADKIIVSNQFLPSTYAEYTRGATQIPFVNVIQNALDNLLMRRFIELFNAGQVQEMMSLWHSAVKMMALFLYPVFLLMVFIAPVLIPAVFSDKYINSVSIFQIYTCSLLFRVTTYNVILRAIGKTGALMWISALSTVFNVTLTLLLIELIGINGAPLATTLNMLLLASSYLYMICKYLDISAKEIFPWANLLRIFIHSLLSLLPLFFVMGLDLAPWPKMGLIGLIYGLVLWCQLKWFKIIPDSDRAVIKDFLPARLRWVL